MNDIEHPSPKVLTLWRVELMTTWGIMLLIAIGCSVGLVSGLDAPSWLFGLIAFPIVFAGTGMLLLKLRWQRWTFQLTPLTLEMSHGIVVRRKRIVSLSRIQHVDFTSGPIGRKLNLVHVVVHTAGATIGTIPGIPMDRAERLRSELMSGPKAI